MRVGSTMLYTAEEAAELTGVNLVTLRRRARVYKIGQRAGRDWLFETADLDKLRVQPQLGRPFKPTTEALRA